MSLLDTASLILTPNGYKGGVTTGKLYSVKPTNASGDMVVTRNTTSTRVNSAGNIELVAFNAPRLDYTNASCPSILVEPLRTNSVLYSEEFSNASWIKTNTTVTADTTTAPDGTTTADTITGIGALGARLIQSNSISFTASTSYSLSVFAKKGTNDFIQLFVPLGIGGMFANFNINTGVVGTLGTVTGTAPTSSITNYGNGWYRCTINFTATTTTSTVTSIGIVTSASAIRSETNTLTTSLILWGAQMEAGSNATSYIPTTTLIAGVTRLADVISKTGITNLIGQTEGTLFVDFNFTQNVNTSRLIAIGDGTTNNRAFISLNANTIEVFIRNASAIQYSVSSSTILTGRYKVAVRYKQNDFGFYINGVPINTSNSGNLPINLNNFYLASFEIGGSANAIQSINSAQIYKTALTDAQCISLTT